MTVAHRDPQRATNPPRVSNALSRNAVPVSLPRPCPIRSASSWPAGHASREDSGLPGWLHLIRSVEVSILLTMREHLANEIRKALAAAPCTLRALGRAAGVSNAALVRIRRGTLAATPTVALKLADALEHWATSCAGAAKRLRVAARQAPPSRKRREQ
jgi:hypothetical protein